MRSIRNIVIAAAALSLVRVSEARADNCVSPFHNGYNASGSLTRPGPGVNSSYHQETWTWSRYVADSVLTGTKSIWQGIGLETVPVQNLSDPSLPYSGCVIVLSGFTPSDGAANDSGNCSSVLSSACVKEIISGVNKTASLLSGISVASGDTCSQLVTSFATGSGSECENFSFTAENFTFPPTSVDTVGGPGSNGGCRVANAGDSNSADLAFIEWDDDDTAATFTEVTQISQPIIFASWLKPTKGSSGPVFGSADTQLMCIPVSTEHSSSGNGNGSQQSGAVGMMGGLQKGTFAFLGLAVLVSLVL